MKSHGYHGRLRRLILFIVLIVSVLLLAGCGRESSQIKPPLAEKGVLDLTGWDFEKDGVLRLDGEWAFYWGKLLSPQDFAGGEEGQGQTFVHVPASWNDYTFDGGKLPGEGFATYRLKVLLSNQNQILALKIGTISSSFKLWVNGVEVAAAGVVGNSPKMVQHSFCPGAYAFSPKGDTADVVLQVANFKYNKGGVWEGILLGTYGAVKTSREMNIALDLFLIGALMIISLYYMGFFIFRRKEKAMLYFGLSCLLIAIRTSVIGNNFMVTLFPGLSWDLLRKVEFISFYLAVLTLIIFFRYLFPEENTEIQVRITMGMAGLFVLQTLVLPLKIYSDTNNIYLLFSAVMVVLTTIELIMAVVRKREGALFSLIGCSVFYVTVINDMLNTVQIIHTANLASAGLLIFVLMQAIILARKMSNAFTRAEILSKETEKALDKVKRTLDAVSRTGGEINHMVEELNGKSTSLMALSNKISQAMEENSAGIENENKSIQGSVKSLNMLVGKINSVSSRTNVMADISLNAKAVSHEGGIKMEEMIQSVRDIKQLVQGLKVVMEKVKASSSKSSEMLQMIKTISQNTRMLSFNATVEAAKANEFGKGFAVIAHNIRELSNSSNRFAQDINVALNEIEQNIMDAVQATEQCEELTESGEQAAKNALESFMNIQDCVENIYQETDHINKNTESISGLAGSVLAEFTNIASVVEETNASIEEVASSTQVQLDYIRASKEALEQIKNKVEQLNEELK